MTYMPQNSDTKLRHRTLEIPSKDGRRWDLISLGEVMLTVAAEAAEPPTMCGVAVTSSKVSAR